ncbi:hypothetical protein [Pseudomonas sp. OTU5201]|uniref:hypothetical protein n=1 Tax=Pseudomonas sp. OTU5201 TaxID=3043850 RepID=UPI00313D3118
MGEIAHWNRTRDARLMTFSLAFIVSRLRLQRPHDAATRNAKQFLTYLTKDSAKNTVKQPSIRPLFSK